MLLQFGFYFSDCPRFAAIFTEDSKDIAKVEIASLRKLKKDIEDARKSAKKEWNKPFDLFEANMKPVSYTHLDVYKRQDRTEPGRDPGIYRGT